MEPTKAAMSAMGERHVDSLYAKQTADQLVYMFDRFIPVACRREALEHAFEICFKEGLELTSKLMRKEYEAWKQTHLDLSAFNKAPPDVP